MIFMMNYVYIVTNPDGETFVYRDEKFAQDYITQQLLRLGSIMDMYLDDIKEQSEDTEYIPQSFGDFVRDIIAYGDITDYDFSMNEYPIYPQVFADSEL
jgi:hypothetical protein